MKHAPILILCFLLGSIVSCAADAQVVYQPAPNRVYFNPQPSFYGTPNRQRSARIYRDPSLPQTAHYCRQLQAKVDKMAQRGLVWCNCKPGGHLGAAHEGGYMVHGLRSEGTGHHSRSGPDAVRNTCNYGQRTLVAYAWARIRPGVRGAGRYIAVAQYR